MQEEEKTPLFIAHPLQEEIPAELLVEPEKRLVGTQLTAPLKASTKIATAITLLFIVLVSQFYWIDPWNWADLMPAVNRNIFVGGEYWRLFTSVLIHADLGHLLSNLYMLGIFSYFIYGHFGIKAYPFYTFLGAALVNLIAISTYPPEVRLLGASGWVYLLGGFWLSIYLMIQRQYSFPKRMLRVFGMSLMVFFPTSFEPTTSYRTHFIGFVVGVAIGFYYYFTNKKKIREAEKYRIVV